MKAFKRGSVKVASDAWRVRRRAQEKKAGRWTDGTLRMNRLWDHFHWVLNVDDPLDAVWARPLGAVRVVKHCEIIEVSGTDIWGKWKGGNW
jgi:hypothetical protein